MSATENVQVNPLLTAGRIPGETFQLPSGGLFYDDGELSPSVKNGEVHIFPMTALDEILIKTPDLLYSGQAIVQIFSRCIPDIIKPLRLLARDIDYLLICLRSISFGSDVTVIQKHTCKDANDQKYDVSILEFINKTKRLDSAIVNSEYLCELDDGKKVYISPMRYDIVVDMMTAIKPDKELTPEELHEETTKQLASLISHVFIPAQTVGNADEQDVHDQMFIIDWVRTLTLPVIRKINHAIERVTEWGPDTTFMDTCKDCGEEIEIITPLNPMNFFT